MSKKTLQFGAYLERIFINNMVKNQRQKKAKIDGSATIISCKNRNWAESAVHQRFE